MCWLACVFQVLQSKDMMELASSSTVRSMITALCQVARKSQQEKWLNLRGKQWSVEAASEVMSALVTAVVLGDRPPTMYFGAKSRFAKGVGHVWPGWAHSNCICACIHLGLHIPMTSCSSCHRWTMELCSMWHMKVEW